MTALSPAPADLGLESPALGPWFSHTPSLDAPSTDDLAVSVTFNTGDAWLPATAGLLSLAVTTTPRPAVLATLRNPLGAPAFAPDRLVALFRLLPEAEERLHALTAVVGSADGQAADVPTRARVRWLALELPENNPTLATLEPRLSPPIEAGISGDEARARHVGLGIDGGRLTNLERPMTDLKRPGVVVAGETEKLLDFEGTVTARLFAFDAGGRPVDPGAVAAWWRHLADTAFTNLWAPGLPASDQRTAATADGLTLHLVGPGEGPADDGVLSRLAVTNVDGDGPVRSRGSVSAAAALALTGGSADDAPEPKVALLPNGGYGATLDLWPAGPVAPDLDRDFVRVGLVDVERHLVGQARTTTASEAPAQRRAADQARASTRVEVRRATAPVLATTTDEAAAALVGVLGGADAARLVAPVLERAFAPLAAPDLPEAPLPDVLPEPTVIALVGGGAADGATITGQRVLFELDLGAALAGAWIRVWQQEFDARRGVHVRGSGGGGLAQAGGDGRVRLVLPLPDGAVAPAAPLGVDVLLVTGAGTRLFADRRFDRPAPVGGAPVPLSAATGDVVACETGQVFAGGMVPDGAVASGATLVALEPGGPALVDPASVPAAALAADTVANTLGAGDVAQLTQPAYRQLPAGDTTAVLAAGGATVRRHARNGLERLTKPGGPLPTMERLEVAAAAGATAGATDAAAAVGATPPRAVHHELLPHQAGHPGAPADAELHGTGARLDGPAAVAVAEYVRERTAGSTPDLAALAATPLTEPPEPDAPSPWAAVLRSVGFGVESEPGLPQLITAAGDAYPFGDTLVAIRDWLAARGITLPGGLDAAANSVVRALDRRMRAASHGLREGAESVRAAIGRAEDLVYIETPAFDDLAFGGADDRLELWETLRERLEARRGLRVLVCLARRLAPGYPPKLQRVRDALVREAIDSLRAAADGSAAQRVAFLTPSTGPGRALRLAATTVVVDDAYALTGTTHLWRRGLSFDSSLAVAVFDETLDEGRPAEVRAFRRALVADRLGVDPVFVPDDPADLVDAVRTLVERDSGGRLATDAIEPPDPEPSTIDRDVWNRDGSATPTFDPVGWIAGAIQAELAAEVPPVP
jgi:hypothetical protein